MSLSGTLAMKFWSNWTSIFFGLASLLIFGDGMLSTNKLMGRERSFNFQKCLRNESFEIIVVLHRELSYLEIKNTLQHLTHNQNAVCFVNPMAIQNTVHFVPQMNKCTLLSSCYICFRLRSCFCFNYCASLVFHSKFILECPNKRLPSSITICSVCLIVHRYSPFISFTVSCQNCLYVQA